MGITTFRLNARVSLFSIDLIAAGHSGHCTYTCTVSNAAASVNYTATLAVNGWFQGL